MSRLARQCPPWWAPSLLVLTTSSAGAAGDCFVVYPGTGVAFGSSAVIAMTVPKGTVCAEPVRVGAGQITSLRVKVRAQRGVAGVQGTTRFAYKAPNEPGRDSFVPTMTGQGRVGAPATSDLHFVVTVTE